MTSRWQTVRLWARRAAGLAPTFVLALLLTNGSAPVMIRAEALLVLIVTTLRPAIGLMIVACLAPLGDVIAPLVGAPPARHAETLVVAFLAGWLSFRVDEDEPGPALPANLADGMWILGGVLIASVTTTALQLYHENAATMTGTLATLAQGYLLNADDPIGVHAAGRLLEGLGLVVAAAQIAQRNGRNRIRLLRYLVVAGVVAAIASALLAVGVAPARTLARHAAVGLARYSAINADVNATASMYLLLVGVCLGVAMSGRRGRRAWLLAAVIMLAALTLTGSGAALLAGAAVVSGALLWIAFSASRQRKIAGLLVLVLVAGGAIAFIRTPRSASSLEMRGGFTRASMRLIEGQPVFGVGAGRYYPLSRLVLPPRLSLAYGLENAHDYYLQIAVELGVVGAIAFGWVLMAALGPELKRVYQGKAEGVLVGSIAGALAYLLTALAGHPFLIPETAVPFWIVLGVLVTEGSAPARRLGWRSRAAILFACALLLTAPRRGGAQVRLQPEDYGFGAWQTDESGRPFRQADAAASIFVGPAITAVEIPMRATGVGPADHMLVTVTVPRSSGVDKYVGNDWTTQVVALPGAEILVPGQRINLAISAIAGAPPARETPHVDIGRIRIVEGK